MSNDDRIMWTLADDRLTVRLLFPPLPVKGMPKPIKVFMDLDAGTVEELIERLIEVRARMLPPPADD